MLKIQNMQKQYGDFSLDVSMEIPEGRVTGLVGKNGAGKTTVIKSILGLVFPSSGTAELFGKNCRDLTAGDRENMGIALSDSGFSGYITIKDVVRILKNTYSTFDEEAFIRNCRDQGLPFDKQIKDLSTGMKAKLRVLSAISHKAELLIMDEPTAGLDVEARGEILDMIREFLEENPDCSMLLTSHIAGDIEGLCDDIYLIHDGKIMLHEETDRILSDYALLKMSDEEYETIDKSRILKAKKEDFGYSCFTDDRSFYAEKYPGIVIEKGGIDELILMMAGRRK